MFFLDCLFPRNNKEMDMFTLRVKHFGPVNSNRIIYYIEEDSADLGFFAMYRCWLEYLYFADVCGYTPVISAGNHFTYKEEIKVNGTANAFEYYFVQPAEVSLREVKISRNVIESDLDHRKMVELILTGKVCSYKYNKRYLYMMSNIVKKYIKLNKETKDFINRGLMKLNFEKERVLGVHIRGTDFRAKYDNHPMYVTEEECFREIKLMLDKNSYSKIFLATDDERILSNFITEFGNQVCFYEDVERSSRNKSVAFSRGKRENHKYLLGLEVIRDMYTLSKCSGLVAGISQVAICAQINKLSRGEKYEEIKIIDKGLYKNGHFFSRYY